jgi:hypothetical protein
VFDFANPHASTGMRPQTIVATQGLFMLNDGSVTTAADATARRLLEHTSSAEGDKLVDTLFELVLSATPSEDERAEILAFVRQSAKHRNVDGDNDAADVQAWSEACQALFASSRFQILD